MPSIVPARRSYSSMDEEEEEEEEEPSHSEEGTPQPSKRAKTTAAGGSRRTTNDSWRLDSPDVVSRHRASPQSNSDSNANQGLGSDNGPPDHQPGAIIRVTLKNFVTYSNASFFPGPSLNMVIGPNGTGKSTLVCAICLGLGWSPRHLGRAKEVTEFIKHGAKNATIEIELQGRPGKINPVIKRQIDHQKGGNHWWINGQTSTEKHTRGVAESFNIQIDNLCQFLPQDRVAEFANLKPVEKLSATIRAAAPVHMAEEHEQLKGLRVKQREAEKDISGQRSQLQNLEGRQIAQRADVDRVRERQQVLDEIDFLEKQRPSAEYAEALRLFREAAEAHTRGAAELDKLKEEVEPSMQAVNAKQSYQAKIQQVLTQKQKLYENVELSASKLVKKTDELSQKMKLCNAQVESEVKEQAKRKKEFGRVQGYINEIKLMQASAEPQFDSAAFNERVRAKRREKGEAELDRREVEDKRTALLEEFKQKETRVADAKKDMEALKTDVGQRGKLLQRTSLDVYKAWEWVQEHQNDKHPDGQKIFQDVIYGPALLECSVKNETWAPAIESLFQQTELLALTCTNDSDLRTLSEKLHKQLGLGSVPLRTSTVPLDRLVPPISEAEMQRLGIASWAKDYLEGPDVIISMLCGDKQVHKTAILEQEESARQHELLTESPVDAWLTVNKSTRTTRRREYNAFSVRTQRIQQQARFWASQPVDHAAIAELQDNIDGWQIEVEELRTKGKETSVKLKDISKTVERLENEAVDIETEKNEAQTAHTQFRALPIKLRTQTDKLADLQRQEEQSIQHVEDIGIEESQHALTKGQHAIDYATLVGQLRQMHVQGVEAAIALLEATSDVSTLQARNADITRLLQETSDSVQELRAKQTRLKDAAKAAQNIMKRTWVENTGLRERLESLPDEERNRTPQQIDLQIESKQARLELLHGGSAAVIEEFEERARKIDHLRTQISTYDTRLAELTTTIHNIRSTWEPGLDALIAQISEAFGAFFARIKCAGEVQVYKASSEANADDGADFENWAIHLKVKFRENEQMSLLDSHRQSGGERAVSTMFYLMALQRLSKAPFRVVDEINQGMDPRNERIVHEMMVDIACGDIQARGDGGGSEHERGSQYFLITPKLLTGLKYKAGMKVHCIASGEFMPPDPGKMDLKKLIGAAKKVPGLGFGNGTGASRGVSVSA